MSMCPSDTDCLGKAGVGKRGFGGRKAAPSFAEADRSATLNPPIESPYAQAKEDTMRPIRSFAFLLTLAAAAGVATSACAKKEAPAQIGRARVGKECRSRGSAYQ